MDRRLSMPAIPGSAFGMADSTAAQCTMQSPQLGKRRDGWEARLADVIERARAKSYVLGEHDCFRVACAAVEALTGVDLWPQWAGRYRTRREAADLIARYAWKAGAGRGADLFTAAFSRLFGTEPVPVKLARRGDILEYVDREPHLAVCMGRAAAALGERGLRFVPVENCRHAWRIG